MKDNLVFRRSILLQLEAARPSFIPFDTLATGLNIAGFKFSQSDFESALDYLAEKKLVEISRSRISAGHKVAKLSAVGMEYLESGEY